MYNWIKPLLFRLSPELAHELTLDWLGAAERLGVLSPCVAEPIEDPVTVMGLRFGNRVGLAAGLDKNAVAFNALGALGFGFVEVGTVTPRPQAGNPRPRLFRLAADNAIINRMGFNNDGVERLVAQLAKGRRFAGPLGINIGKNKDTPDEQALADYLTCLDAVYPYADYVTVNISSPNTPGLRALQFGEALAQLLAGIKQRQQHLSEALGRYVPIAVKIAPDMEDEALAQIARQLCESGLDAVIATNTTLSREGVAGRPHADEAGGLSGAPLRTRSTQVVKTLAECLGKRLPIIGVGGIDSGEAAAEKIRAGASLVQLYSGLIYRGPALIGEAATACRNAANREQSFHAPGQEGQDE
jgi:dihydroorotate dehydrogenase